MRLFRAELLRRVVQPVRIRAGGSGGPGVAVARAGADGRRGGILIVLKVTPARPGEGFFRSTKFASISR